MSKCDLAGRSETSVLQMGGGGGGISLFCPTRRAWLNSIVPKFLSTGVDGGGGEWGYLPIIKVPNQKVGSFSTKPLKIHHSLIFFCCENS